MARFTLIHVNRDPRTGQEELLCPVNVVEHEGPVEAVLWAEDGWLDGIDEEPCGEIVRKPEGHFGFPNDDCLRIYVQEG